MDWDQACAYHEVGAISARDLMRVAHDTFDGVALDDVLADIAYNDLAAQDFIEQSPLYADAASSRA